MFSGVLEGSDGEPVKELQVRTSLQDAYAQLWAVVKLPAMRRFSLILVLCRLGMLPAEQASHSLSHLEPSLPKP